jgi:antitoxin FitA
MSMIQIRGVPEQLHRKLKARAALAGQSLSDYLLAEIRRSLERPTREELLARVAGRARVALEESAADALHAERNAR